MPSCLDRKNLTTAPTAAITFSATDAITSASFRSCRPRIGPSRDTSLCRPHAHSPTIWRPGAFTMNADALLDQTRQRALAILYRCVTPCGFRASGLAAGYPQIWARDNGIVFLGAVASGDPQLIAAGRAALETMSAHQSPRGLIQLNVNPDTGYVSTEN